jgi:hypothetical protein
MPSILKTKARRVLKYFNENGFSNIKLTLFIMKEESDLNQLIELEQDFINNLNPNLNVDLIAKNSGYHGPVSEEIRNKFRIDRGIPIYIYKADDLTLLYIFESKQHMYNSIKIHHKTLNNCINEGKNYLDTFFFSLDLIKESDNINILNLSEVKLLFLEKRNIYNIKHPRAKRILAEFKDDLNKNLEFESLNSLAKYLKGDRQVIREYLKGNKLNYYRGK